MNDFNKGIDYAFDFIKENLMGRVVNGRLEGVVTEEDLEMLRKKIHRKCNFCSIPCETSWCSTKDFDDES